MSLQDITITGSIGSIATQSYGQRTYISSTDEQSFPIEEITGNQAGVWPNFIPGTDYTVDLIVNVTQSWSGSNITPLGTVPYVHNTMEEFIDGEFSGSNYVVTNGNLNDAQCEQFLTVSTVPTSYSVFPYSIYRLDGAVQGTSQFGVFINDLTSPPNGGILLFKEDDDITYNIPPVPSFTIKYVKITYLKISRFDKEGNDNTLSLQELTNIRWYDTSGVGLIDLKVLNISEYPTYYLYAVLSKTFINPTYVPGDDNILNYSLSASFTGTSASAGLQYLDNWNIHNISNGTFNTYYYTFDYPSPNIYIKYTASITAYNGNVSPVIFDFNFIENTYVGTETYFSTIAQTQSVTLNSGDTKTFTLKGLTNSSFIGNPSSQYHLEIKGKGFSLPISLSNTFWIVTNSVAPQTSTSSVVLEPYLLSNFANSDCDVLMNNYSENDYSNFYREVLYDNGGTVPSNLKQIINNTAQFAEVNDYLYNASANRLPRYEGVRTTSAGINLPSKNGLTNKELANISFPSDLIINNGTPSVTDLQTYFAYFDYITDTSYELINKSAAHIIYLIDKDGNIQTPTLTGSYYYNLIDNFITNDKSNIIVEDPDGSKIFVGNKTVIRPGVIPRAILYTQTGSGYNVQNGIFFGDSGSVVANNPINYVSRYSTTQPSQTLDFNGDIILDLNYTTLASQYIHLNAGNNWLEVISGSNNVQISFGLSATFFLSNPYTTPSYNQYNLGLYLEKSEDGGSSWFTVAYTPFNTRPYTGTSNSTNAWYPQDKFTPVTGHLYRFRFTNPSSYYRVIFYPQTNIVVTQTPPATSATASINIANYWVTGSQLDGTPKNIINSTQLLPLYTPSNPIYQSYNPDDGYAPCLPFVINSGDQIRFEGDELQTYTIGKAEITNVFTKDTPYSNYNNIWNHTSNWTINSSTSATCTGGSLYTQFLSFEAPTDPFNDTQWYTFYFEVTSYTSGQLLISLGGLGDTINITGTGFYSGSFQRDQHDQTQIYIYSNNFIGTISNLTGIGQSLVLTLDNNISEGTDLNSFLIRRFQPNPNYVILDTPLINGIGYLLPEYATDELKQNFDKIIVSLRERTLI
jgi:hypothetical protein